jgi:amidase
MSVQSSQNTARHFAPAWQLAADIARRQVGCLEALEMYLDRVKTHDTSINSVIVRDFERARERARELDAAATPTGPLHGVPITVKESFDIDGLPTTYGVPGYENNVPGRKAVAVARLEAAGAVVFGKTNVPRSLLDWQSFNAIYGVTNNPWDVTKTPGGSSGGAAAAVAAGLTGLEIGSDIGGSIRVPAHMCGIFGHKPTWGLLPMIGHSLAGAITPTDISVIGPLARSVRDLQIAFEVLAGPDKADTTLGVALPPPRTASLADMRVAVWAADPAAPTDPEITAQLGELAAFLARRGAKVSLGRPPIDTTDAYELFLKLVAAAVGSRFTPAQLAEAKARVVADPDNTSPDAIMDRHLDLPHSEWLQLSERRHLVRRVWQSFFDDFDVLLCPAFGTAALPHDTTTAQRDRRVVVNGQTIPYNSLSFWPGIIGAYHLPATVAPLGLTAQQLPIGVQIVGRAHADRETLAFARILESEWRSFVPPPEPADQN